GAAVSVLARRAGARVLVLDAGVNAEPFAPHPDLLDLKVARGTRDLSRGPAMSLKQAQECIKKGRQAVARLADEGLELLALGEMGIGNTTPSAALCAAILHLDPDLVTGRGTGLDAEAWGHKVAIIRRALELNDPDGDDALDCLAKVG